MDRRPRVRCRPAPSAVTQARRLLMAARWASFLAACAATHLRQPAFFSAPRFWAEEGAIHFASAWSLPWWRHLVSAPQGYVVLYTSLAAVLAAHLVPLEHAPLVTTLAAYLMQLVPPALIAFGTSPAWRGARRWVAMAIVVVGSSSDEIWLTTASSQFYCALATLVLLVEPAPERGARRWIQLALLAVCGLTGPVSTFLLPLYVVRAVRSRRRADVAQAIVLAATAAVQATAVAAALLGAASPARGLGVGFASVTFIVWMKMLVLPVFGPAAAERFRDGLAALARHDLGSWSATAVAVVLAVAAAALLGWLARGAARGRGWALAGGFGLVAVLSAATAVGDQLMLLRSASSASRYAYVPGVALLLLLLENVRRADGRTTARAGVATALLAVALVGDVARFRSTVRWDASWPRWRTEVAAWRGDPRHALRIWPPGWELWLPAGPPR
jgi:hypothetical protein